MKRILIYSPYSLYTVHSFFDRLLALKFLQKQHEVKIVYCDGIFETCDSKKNCFVCKLARFRVDGEFGTHAEPFDQYVRHEDISHELSKIEKLSDSELLNYKYDDFNLSNIIRSSFFSYFRITNTDFKNAEERSQYIKFLQSSVMACHGMSKLMSEFKPDFLITFNARHFSHKIATLYAERMGADYIAHELGAINDSMWISHNADTHSMAEMLKKWEEIQDVSLTEDEFLGTVKALCSWRLGKKKSGLVFIDPARFSNPIDEMVAQSDKSEKTILFMTSSVDEVAATTGYEEFYDSQNEWIEKSIEYLIQNPKIFGIIRFHPHTISKIFGTVKETVDYMNELKSRNFPPNIKIIYPDQKVNTYSLMGIADIGSTYGTTAGLEMLAMKKRVVISRRCVYYGMPFVDRYEHKDQYHRTLSSSLSRELSIEEHAKAIRFFKHYVLSFSTPFLPIRFLNDRTSFMNFYNFNEIKHSETMEGMYQHLISPTSSTLADAQRDGADIRILTESKIHHSGIPRKTIIVSSLSFNQFWNKNNPEYNFYKRIILQRGGVPEVVFYKDIHFTKNHFDSLGGFRGYFSNIHTKYYRTFFKVPFINPVQKFIRKAFFTWFKIYYTHNKIIRTLMRFNQADYVVDFTNSEFIKSVDSNARYFGIRVKN
jgi:hypothetical protein